MAPAATSIFQTIAFNSDRTVTSAITLPALLLSRWYSRTRRGSRHELGSRHRGVAPPRGAGAADGRAGEGQAPARWRQAHGARAHRPPARPRQLPEIGALAGRAQYGADGELKSFQPANFVFGRGRIEG